MADTLHKKSVTWTKQFGLVMLLLVSAPSSVFSGRIPTIPAGHRTQYLLLRPDGGYSSGYDTGLGQIELAEGNAQNEVRGAYAGGPLRVSYTAGVGGYVPTVEVQTPPTPQFAVPPPPPPPPPSPPPPPQRPFEPANAQVVHNSDGSYSFSYRTSDQSREESADANNNVRGSFSFVPPDDGVRRTVNYQAGAQTGFVAQGAHLPTAPNPTVSGQTQPTTVFVPEETQTEEGGTTTSVEEGSGNSDASYSFAYRTPDQERFESSDSAGNVEGTFSFVAPDGVNRRVHYEAGANKGFVAKGDHLPTPPPVTSGATPQVFEPRTPVSVSNPPVNSWSSGQWKTVAWNNPAWNSMGGNAGSWSVTVPDPSRVDSDLGNFVVRNYLPSHPRKAGYVFDIKE